MLVHLCYTCCIVNTLLVPTSDKACLFWAEGASEGLPRWDPSLQGRGGFPEPDSADAGPTEDWPHPDHWGHGPETTGEEGGVCPDLSGGGPPCHLHPGFRSESPHRLQGTTFIQSTSLNSSSSSFLNKPLLLFRNLQNARRS